MSYSSLPAGFSITCTDLTPVASPGKAAAGQHTEGMVEVVVRRQVCAVGTMSVGAHQWQGAGLWMGRS